MKIFLMPPAERARWICKSWGRIVACSIFPAVRFLSHGCDFLTCHQVTPALAEPIQNFSNSPDISKAKISIPEFPLPFKKHKNLFNIMFRKL